MKLIIAAICFISMMIGRDNKTVEELSTLPKDVKQVILVQDHKLSLWNRMDVSECKDGECGNDESSADGSGWEMAFEVPCHYGKNGLSADRHDGDGTTPIGLFKVLYCFGNAPDPG